MDYSKYLTEAEWEELYKKKLLTISEFKILFDIENTGTVIGYSDMSNETAVLFGLEHLDNGEINIEALLYILRIPRREDEMKELTIRVNQIWINLTK